jgi:hypothetical protein
MEKSGKDDKEILNLIENLDGLFRLQGNKDVWLYTLSSLGEIDEEQIGKVSESFYKFKKEDKKVSLSTIFKEADIQLQKDSFFDHVCFDYYLPSKKELKEMFIKDVSSLTLPSLVEEKIIGNNRKGTRIFKITDYGRESAKLRKNDFEKRFRPLLREDGLVVTSMFGSSPEITTKTS